MLSISQTNSFGDITLAYRKWCKAYEHRGIKKVMQLVELVHMGIVFIWMFFPKQTNAWFLSL